MYSPTKEFLQHHHQMLLEQAKTARLLKQSSRMKAPLHERLLWHSGEALIAFGYTLKRFSRNADSETSLPIYDMT
jgi:hypothetical protein